MDPKNLQDVPLPDLCAIRRCIRSLPSELRLFPPCTSYCYHWMMGNERRCGKKCKYRHSRLPRGSLATSMATASLGQFAIEDGSKEVSNQVLSDLAGGLEEQRCFVLDGKNGATIRSLQRPRDRILSPNVDEDAAKALRARSLSVDAHTCAALLVALQAKAQFGCVYLDYMWPLNYFQSTQREVGEHLSMHQEVAASCRDAGRLLACQEYVEAPLTDGLRDLELLVLDPGHSLLSQSGAVVAVTLVHSQKSSLQSQRALLEEVLIKGAELHEASLDFLLHTRPCSRPVATYFYGWNLQGKPLMLPQLPEKLEKFRFFDDSGNLYTPQRGAQIPRPHRRRGRGKHGKLGGL